MTAPTPPVTERYRIGRIGPQPKELVGVVDPLDTEWILVRNHDDEAMGLYATKAEAEAALREANK